MALRGRADPLRRRRRRRAPGDLRLPAHLDDRRRAAGRAAVRRDQPHLPLGIDARPVLRRAAVRELPGPGLPRGADPRSRRPWTTWRTSSRSGRTGTPSWSSAGATSGCSRRCSGDGRRRRRRTTRRRSGPSTPGPGSRWPCAPTTNWSRSAARSIPSWPTRPRTARACPRSTPSRSSSRRWRPRGSTCKQSGFRDLPMNRGWMGVFRRWSGTPALRRLWPILRGEYRQDFVKFCEDQLELGARVDAVARDELDAGFVAESMALLGEEFAREWPEEPSAGRPGRRRRAELGRMDPRAADLDDRPGTASATRRSPRRPVGSPAGSSSSRA